MDGIDRLAAGIAILGFIVFSILSIITNHYTLALIFLTLIGSLIAFLIFNFSKNQKIFMGDGGSLVLGFILVISGISLLQNTPNHIHHSWVIIGVISVLFIPVLDAIRVFRRRAKSGKSPFSADKTHLHHLLLINGIQHKPTTLIILFMMTFLILFGYLGFNFLGITFSIVSMLFMFHFVTSILQFNNKLKHWKERIHVMENKR